MVNGGLSIAIHGPMQGHVIDFSDDQIALLKPETPQLGPPGFRSRMLSTIRLIVVALCPYKHVTYIHLERESNQRLMLRPRIFTMEGNAEK